MKTTMKLSIAALMLAGAAASAQTNSAGSSTAADTGAKKEGPAKVSLYRPININHLRPADQRGVNMFETPKEDQVPFTGFALSFGGAFTQDFQGLQHNNSANPVLVSGVNTNQLINIGHGFNNAVANLNIDAQLAPGVRVAMTSYLSARHHQETWVKDGYLLVDDSPIDMPLLKNIMKYTTLRVGHFEINYGDSHFRRSDNGNSMFNPFVGNYIMDDFTTEIGAEVYLRNGPWLAMVGATGGEVHGWVTTPEKRSPSVLGKIGFDKKIGDDIRFRLTASGYANNKSASNTLFTGDRGGSKYYDIVENTASTEKDNAWSGQVRPGFSNKVSAQVINPFVKIGGLEYFGNYEIARGQASTEPKMRNLRQQVSEVLYRIGDTYVGGRYNKLSGQLVSKNYDDKDVTRYQVGGGWFVTPNILAKAEWVNQKYEKFAATDIRNGAQFKGFMISGVVGF